MKGKTKLTMAFIVLALVALSLFVSMAPTKVQADDIGENTNTNTEKSYSTCGGIEGCRTSCGCGCRGNPDACGCGG